MNGNRVVSRSAGGVSEFAATRVATGAGAGRDLERVSRLGAATAFEYDAHGRTLSETTTWNGETRARIMTYPADALDRRPATTTAKVNGVVTSVQTFTETFDGATGCRVTVADDNGLVTRRVYNPSDADANGVDAGGLFAAGRLRSVTRPDGRMTRYDYDGGALTVTATEGVADAAKVARRISNKRNL